MRKERFEALSYLFLCFFWATVPLSVTLSQGFAILSISFAFLAFGSSKKSLFSEIWFLPFVAMLLFYVGSFLFGINKSYVSKNTFWHNGEWRDAWMLLLLPVSYWNAKSRGCDTPMRLMIGFLILFSLLSLFFPYRLSTYVMNGFQHLEGNRLPHQIGSVAGVSFFLPIGFQNTHLTHGALLGFSWFWLLGYLVKQSQKSVLFFLSLGLLSINSCLLLLNQSRSIWFGIFFSLGMLLILNSEFWKVKRKKKIFLAISLFAFFSVPFFLIFQFNWIFRRAIEQLLVSKTLENQRLWIYWGSLQIIFENFPFGIGAGSYPSQFLEAYDKLIEKNPFLFYEISITPNSHAHHDALHALVVGGIISLFGFLWFWYSLVRNLSIRNLGLNQIQILSPFILLVAGMFQCFVLDDEVALPFFSLVGFFLFKSESQNTDYKSVSQKRNSILWIYASLPFLLSFLNFYFISSKNVALSFEHRIKDESNRPFPPIFATLNSSSKEAFQEFSSEKKEVFFRLEGCLSHDFNMQGLAKVREKPIQIQFIFPPKELNSDKSISFPETIQIEFRKRESIDQDKSYRLQKEWVVGEKTIKWKGERSIVVDWEGPMSESKDRLFHDFGIRYKWQKEIGLLPQIQIYQNCSN